MLTQVRSTVAGAAGAVRLGILVAATVAGAHAQVSVTAVRHWSLGDVTRIAVETSGEFRYTYSRLSNPDRIYFDIRGAKQRVSPTNDFSEDVGDGLLEKIRVAQNRRDVVRVVLYLTGKLEVKDSLLANPNRLVLEIRGKAPPAQAAARTPLPEIKTTPAQQQPTAEAVKPPEVPQTAEAAKPQDAPREAEATEPPVPLQTAGAVKPLVSKETAETHSPPEPPATPIEKPPARPTPTTQIAAAKPEPTPVEMEPVKEEAPLVATPAQNNRAGGQSLTRALGLKIGRIVIDPGHGGRDTGTIGPTGLREKDVTLEVARHLGKLIEEKLGSEVIYTRSGDETVSLERRTEIANEARADLFLSIHVNSSRYRSVGGVETFYLNLTRSRADLEVAARENAGSNQSIHELTNLVQKIALDDKMQESREFATRVQTEVHSLAKKRDASARNRGVKSAPFVVLIGAKMPSVLVELGFISNPSEEKLLGDAGHRQKVADALYQGLSSYASTLSHFEVAQVGGGE